MVGTAPPRLGSGLALWPAEPGRWFDTVAECFFSQAPNELAFYGSAVVPFKWDLDESLLSISY